MTLKKQLLALAFLTLIAAVQSCGKDKEAPAPPSTTTLELMIKDSRGNAAVGATVRLYTSISDLRLKKNQFGDALITDAEGKIKVTGVDDPKYYWLIQMGCQNNNNGMQTSESNLVANSNNKFEVELQPSGTLVFGNRSRDPYKIFIDSIEYMQQPGLTVVYIDKQSLDQHVMKVVQVVPNPLYPAEETLSVTLDSCGSSVEFRFPAYR